MPKSFAELKDGPMDSELYTARYINRARISVEAATERGDATEVKKTLERMYGRDPEAAHQQAWTAQSAALGVLLYKTPKTRAVRDRYIATHDVALDFYLDHAVERMKATDPLQDNRPFIMIYSVLSLRRFEVDLIKQEIVEDRSRLDKIDYTFNEMCKAHSKNETGYTPYTKAGMLAFLKRNPFSGVNPSEPDMCVDGDFPFNPVKPAAQTAKAGFAAAGLGRRGGAGLVTAQI